MAPHEDSSDEALMAAYAGGDAGAFEVLFERHRRTLFTYLVHHSGRRDVAEDLFQEVFLRVVRSRASYAPTGGFRSWLFVIARNALTDHRRRAGVREIVTTESALDAGGTDMDRFGNAVRQVDDNDPALRTEARALAARIRSALLRLPDAQREVFLLRERAGLDYERIAEVVGCPVATAKSRMRYALAGLRRALAADVAALPEGSHD